MFRGIAVTAAVASLVTVPLIGSTAEATTTAGTRTGTVARSSGPHDLNHWKLDMVENFNTFNSNRWNKRDRTYNANEDSYLLARNTTIDNGRLRIQGRKESVGGRQFTSGYADTNGKYSVPNYFRAKIRAKVPFEQGLWAAPLWFRPADFSGGEIDLIETYGSESWRPKIHQTIHTDYGASHQSSAKPNYYSRVGDSTGTKWHNYLVKKVPGKIVMKVDGVRTAVWRQGDPNWFNKYYEAGKRWNLRVNMQIGGDYGGLPDRTTDWSPDKSAMLVDYIYVWTRK